MKTKFKIFLCVVIVILVTTVWCVRYVSLNSYYASVSNNSRAVYQLGEIVSFGEDYINKDMSIPGYSIKVNRFEIQQFDEYTKALGINQDDIYSKPKKLALVHITLFNDNSVAEGVMLSEFKLHGVDNYVGLDWDILTAVNPVLQGSYGISLSPGTQYDITLPFDLYEEHFGADTWKSINEYQLFLHITAYPVEKDIKLQ